MKDITYWSDRSLVDKLAYATARYELNTKRKRTTNISFWKAVIYELNSGNNV